MNLEVKIKELEEMKAKVQDLEKEIRRLETEHEVPKKKTRKNSICTIVEGRLPSYRTPTAEEESRLLAVPKDECKHELVHMVSAFTIDEVVCSNCGHVVMIFGS